MNTDHIFHQREFKSFYPDRRDPRYAHVLPPSDVLRWLFDQKRYADALAWWLQDASCLDFASDLEPFKRKLASDKSVSLRVATLENLYLTKDIPAPLAALLLTMQEQERIVIGRSKTENLQLIVESYDGKPLRYLRLASLQYPRQLRSYKSPGRRIDFYTYIHSGPRLWPQGTSAEYGNPEDARIAAGGSNGY